MRKKLNKKGVSPVIATLVLVGIVLVSISIVWVVIRGLITESVDETEACFGNMDKISINNLYTCYNSSGNEMQFSINIGDINVDNVLVSISGEGKTKSFEIENSAGTITGVVNYPDRSSSIQLPDIDSGLTYIYDMSIGGFTTTPESISLAPTIKGKRCEVADSLYEIERCY